MPRGAIALRSATAALVAVALVTGCAIGQVARGSAACPTPGTESVAPDAATSGAAANDLVIVGRIVTMDDPPIAEALLIEAGLVTCIGSREDVVARAGDDVPVVDIGENVAYPGFIDAHAHWIGDRDYYGIHSAEDAMEAAVSRGWTSISEQWVNRERLEELEALAAAGALPIRVDAYLTLNAPAPSGEHFGDWYADRQPGSVTEHLRVQGIKMHLDNGWGTIFHWEAEQLTETIGRASAAGWQVAVHTVSSRAHDMVLDAFEAAIGADGPNPRHHRIEHAMQVSDPQLDRMVAMDIATVVHLDATVDLLLDEEFVGNLGGDTELLLRAREFVEAGLHVAAASDAPWFFPEFALTEDIGRPVDQIAGGMDGRGRLLTETPEWALDQLLTAEQGLRAVTVEAAHALDDADRRGHLAPGTVGDVTILSGDVLDATPDQIRGMDVVATVIGGVVAWCGVPQVCSSH